MQHLRLLRDINVTPQASRGYFQNIAVVQGISIKSSLLKEYSPVGFFKGWLTEWVQVVMSGFKMSKGVCSKTWWVFVLAIESPYFQHLYHQIFYFSIWSYISCNEVLRKKNFDLDKKWFFYELLKTWKFYFLAVHPCLWSLWWPMRAI